MIVLDKECEELKKKIKEISERSLLEIKKELYPESLGEAVKTRSQEIRFIILTKYGGMILVLKELGADIKDLEAYVYDELQKTYSGKY